MTEPLLTVSPRGGPLWLHRIAFALGAAYLACLWLDAVGTRIPYRILPAPLHFFVQAAQLFPRAADNVIEWRAKGWRCRTRKFEELDLSESFPIHAGDKENRFDRAMFFYYKDRKVLEALDEYLRREERRLGGDERAIGGVMLFSLRLPIPQSGSDAPRYRRLPLDEVPHSVVRRYWYVTPPSERRQACAEPSE